ncbi:VIT family-domain-containing protein [Daldinia vernicosa]|uniref:VIT family-domain-containing protein n=1 Tax=Daldinia vernicosa TaxID=114800 RepID=UPI0020082035|nr:VIT family-domain-containing protein [Daldinia vernicosa]KAI0845935.1 VIT family-domain-containing protein [Daldinia vernicosa]
MQLTDIKAFFVGLGRQRQRSQKTLKAYSTLATNPENTIGIPMSAGSESNDSSFASLQKDYQWSLSPGRLPEFLSHFTLGFADGLTVPFALTAGLSSLGYTKTVIYAGMAEICAGCISMGISGYLAAKGETAMKNRDHGEGLELAGRENILEYLAPLELPSHLLQYVKDHIDYNPAVSRRLQCHLNSTADGLTSNTKGFPPALVGLSVSVGYMLGGLLPLFPYFFVSEVADGLRWSFVVCVLALFVFGFAKDYLLHKESVGSSWQYGGTKRGPVVWERVKKGCWEGIWMVVMGGIAAVAAVLCVKLFEGVVP